jgi:2-polyprenyl-6-methoxyphenol hydroxylase-like FAD-dependent oxidoreductase
MTDVLIVGAGPAGLLLAGELRLAGVGTVVIERSPRRPDFCRGFNLNPRALDLLARRGLADPLIDDGWQVPQAAFSGLPVTLSLAGARTDHPYSLGIPQRALPGRLRRRPQHRPQAGGDRLPRHRRDPVLARPPADRDAPVTLAMLQSAVDEALGRHVGLCAARWLTRFGNAARQAAEYVRGRVILAGDAAHIHPPAGAIGVNVALDDAFNLGWKLAAAVRGTGPSHLLDSYHTERHPAGAQVLASTQAQVLLDTEADRLRPLADLLTHGARHPAGNRAFAETVTGLDTCYDMGQTAGHPWLGRLAPNIALTTASGDTDLATQLTRATGRPLLLDLAATKPEAAAKPKAATEPKAEAEPRTIRDAAAAWADRVSIVRATAARTTTDRACERGA